MRSRGVLMLGLEAGVKTTGVRAATSSSDGDWNTASQGVEMTGVLPRLGVLAGEALPGDLETALTGDPAGDWSVSELLTRGLLRWPLFSLVGGKSLLCLFNTDLGEVSSGIPGACRHTSYYLWTISIRL